MRLFSSSRTRQRGVALIIAVLTLVILGILAAGFVVGSITEHQMSLNEIDATSAVQLADGGIRAAFQWLDNQTDPPCQSGASITPLGTIAVGTVGTARPTITWANTNDCNNDYQGWLTTITSVGTTASGRTATVEMQTRIQRKNVTCYAIYLGEYCPMPASAWFGDWDRVTGPVHSNCTLQLSQRDPPAWTGAQFWGEVTITSPTFTLAGTPHGPAGEPASYASFYDGYETNVEAHSWPPSLAGTISCGNQSGGGYTIRGQTTLFFKPDGTIFIKNNHEIPYRNYFPNWWPAGPSGTGYTDAQVLAAAGGGGARPGSGVIRVVGPANTNPDILIQGTYAGTWTLICQRHIYFMGDLMPAHDPRFGPSSDIMGVVPAEQALGLGGKARIPDIIPGYPNGIDGDRQICAYVMVPYREGSWEVVDYATRAREGILFLMGGISFGYIGPTETSDFLHGYGTDLWYDNRACEGNNPPPCFPELTTQQGNRPVWTAAQIDSTWREVF